MCAQLDIQRQDHGARVQDAATGAAPAPAECEAERAWLAAIVRSAAHAVVGVGRDGTIRSWNGGAERLYGWSAADAIGAEISMLAPPELGPERDHALARVLGGEAGLVRDELEDLRADGASVAVSMTISPIRDEAGAIIGAARITVDITDRKRLEQELRYRSDHDPLTGLLNRRRFSEELARESMRALRYPSSAGSLLLADLDKVKHVNDTLGHRAGDELICAVARALEQRVRETDVLARVGGDEFAVVLPNTTLDAAWLVGRALRDAVREQVIVLDDGHEVRPSLSVGVAPLGGGMSSSDSMAVADMAMYEAKKRGRDRVVTFRAEPAHLRGALGWAERLRGALADGDLRLYAQPIVELARNRTGSWELLLRLREADGSVVLPGAFIESAERVGMIGEIDRWVISQAIGLLAERPETALAVNVSGLSIRDPGLLSLIAAELARAGVEPARLVVELSETAALAEMGVAGEFVAGLRRIGCGCALDGFGASLRSFACLKHLPVELVKIDGELVRALQDSEHDRLLVRAIVDLAGGLGIRTIAEHVDTAAILALLREEGVGFAQGYELGRPRAVPPRASSEWPAGEHPAS